MTWWCQVQEGTEGNPYPDYRAHLASLRDRIPKDRLQTLDALESVAVHDGRLRELQLDPVRRTLHIFLDTYWEGGKMTLAYTDVESFVSTADPTIGLSGPYGYGDVGYDEIDASPSGAFIHRLLFSSGIEMEIVFEAFQFLREGTTEPEGSPPGQ
jgi:hypothetical protein